MDSPSVLKILTVDHNGNINPPQTNANRGDKVEIRPLTSFGGKVYALKNGNDSCAQLFGIPGLDSLELNHEYTIAPKASVGTYDMSTTKTLSEQAQSLGPPAAQTGELLVGSGGGDDD